MIHLSPEESYFWQRQILLLEEEGKVTRTFRRLDPERQTAVIEALLQEAADSGPNGMSVTRVAARAGCAVGSLYQYFPRREGMLGFAAELAGRFLAEALDGFRPMIAAMPLRDGLRAYLQGGTEWSSTHADLLGLFARAAYTGSPAFGDSLVRPVAESMRAMVRALLDGAAERGELRPGIDVDMTARLVHSLMICAGDVVLLPHLNDYFLLVDDDCPPTRMQESAVDFVVRAIGVERGEER